MKVYLFYLLGTSIENNFDKFPGIIKDSINEINNEKYSLYAFTDDKEIYKEFKLERNMDIFYSKVVHMNKHGYEIFSELNVEYLLEKRDLITKKCVNNMVTSTSVGVISTNMEYDEIFLYKEEVFQNSLNDFFTNIIEDEISNKLIPASLNDELQHLLIDVFLLDRIIPYAFPYEEWPSTDVQLDEFTLFLKLFSNTFKKEGE
jgi:hypothetical protein